MCFSASNQEYERENPSISNYIFLSCCCCFALFDNGFCSVVCWSVVFKMQRQLSTDVLQKCPKIHMKTPVLESLSNRVARLPEKESPTQVFS